MKITVLGCGDAFGSDGRHHTSFLVSADDEHVLLDCGASTLIQLKKEKIDLEQISTIIISHYHGDHYGGIPFFLISSLFERPRKAPLTIIGPEGVYERCMHLQEAMYAGTSDQVKEMDVRFLPYKHGQPLQVGDKTIHAREVSHSPASIPHALRLDWKEKSIAFSGDTSWNDNLIELSKDTDAFICECNFIKQVSFGHLSYEELQEKHELFETKQLWLTHMADEVIHSDEVNFKKLHDGLTIEC